STLESSPKGVSAIGFSPDGGFFAAATSDGMAGVWTVPTWKQQVIFKASSTLIRSIVFTPDSKQLLTGGLEGVVKVWRPLSGQELRAVPSGRGVYALAFIPGSNNIVSANVGGGLKIWDFATEQQVAEIKLKPGFGGLSCSPDGKMIAMGHYENVVYLWSAIS